MYILHATVILDSQGPDTPETLRLLDEYEKQYLSLLKGLLFESSSTISLYHPDEECEMKGIYSAAKNIHLTRKCHKFRSVVLLSQIVQSLTDLLDGVNGISYKCRILDPEVYNKTDEE